MSPLIKRVQDFPQSSPCCLGGRQAENDQTQIQLGEHLFEFNKLMSTFR